MKSKTNKKHAEKKPVQPPLLDAPSTRPVDGKFVTAAQLSAAFPFAGLDETFLRNRTSATNPRTGAPWIPKPRGGKYDLNATVLGLLEWFCAQSASREGLPRVCNSMKHCEEVYALPVELLQYVRSHGGAEAFEASNRVRVLEVLRVAGPLLKKIFSGGMAQIKGVEGMEDLDSDFQLARVRKEDADERARNNALANKNLFTREGIYEDALVVAILKAGDAWRGWDKEHGAKLQSYLTSAGVPLETARAARQMTAASVEKIPAELREIKP